MGKPLTEKKNFGQNVSFLALFTPEFEDVENQTWSMLFKMESRKDHFVVK